MNRARIGKVDACPVHMAWRGVGVAYGVGMGVGRARAVLPVIRPAGHAAKRQQPE